MKNLRGLQAVLCIAAVVLGMGLVWLPEPLQRWSGYGALSGEAEQVVDEVTAQNFKAFMAVSAVKTGLAIIEDSSVGVGFQLEVGDAVQAVYDYVDFVWEALMYSLLVLGAYKILLETGLLHLGLQLVGIGMILWGIAALFSVKAATVRRAAARVVFAGVLMAYLVPAALLAMHYVTAHYTGPVKEKQAGRIEALKGEVDAILGQLASVKNEVDLLRPMESVGAIRERIGTITGNAVATINAGTQAMLYFVVIVLFELLVFPLLSAYLLFKLLHVFFGRAMEQVGAAAKPLAAST